MAWTAKKIIRTARRTTTIGLLVFQNNRGRRTGRQAGKPADSLTDREWETERGQTDTGSETDRLTDRETDRQTDRQTDRENTFLFLFVQKKSRFRLGLGMGCRFLSLFTYFELWASSGPKILEIRAHWLAFHKLSWLEIWSKTFIKLHEPLTAFLMCKPRYRPLLMDSFLGV